MRKKYCRRETEKEREKRNKQIIDYKRSDLPGVVLTGSFGEALRYLEKFMRDVGCPTWHFSAIALHAICQNQILLNQKD